MNIKKIETGVSELLGAILLLMIVVLFFTILYYNLASMHHPPSPLIVDIAGSVKENCIVLEHRGGEDLSLKTEIKITIDNSTVTLIAQDYLDNECKINGVWNLGEKIIYPIKIDILDLTKEPQADVFVIDRNTNTAIMTGTIDIEAECDIGIYLTVNDQILEIGKKIIFTLTATNHGNINVTGVEIEFRLPDELTHYSNVTAHGIYQDGIWKNIGVIAPEQSVVLSVTAMVKDLGHGEPTQLALILDGSDSISPEDWALSLNGLANAIRNKTSFPQDNRVELTLVQYGGKQPAYARKEIGPIIVNQINNATIADTIRNIIQIGDKTPTSCGILLATDTLADSDFYNLFKRQIILLVTDGNPTHCCSDDGDYLSDGCSDSFGPKKAAIQARNNLIKTLEMTESQDEFDAIAVGHSSPHAIWLKNNIVWPEPGYFAPPFQPHIDQGFVNEIETWQEFADSINNIFKLLFSQIPVHAQLKTTAYITDPKIANNFNSILLY